MTTFLDSGKVDDSLYKPATVDFTPAVSHSMIAKIVAGVMLGLGRADRPLVALDGPPVHRRGAYGRKASAALRSVYPIVLGLGGWFLGVLIVLVAFPSVSLDDTALGVLSIGVPVGLGIYWAWVNRDWSAKTRIAGLAAAAGGALVGAWLGFNVTEGLLAVVTTIAGATGVRT